MNGQCNITAVERYRLGPLREVRDLDERTRRGDLAAAVDDARATADDVAVASRRVATTRAGLAAATRAREELLATGATTTRLALADRYVARRRAELDAAIAAHARAAAGHARKLGAIDGARDRLSAARADKQLIERHFERWRDARAKLAERRDD